MRYFILILLLGVLACGTQKSTAENPTSTAVSPTLEQTPTYYTLGKQSYDGTGKYYMGREISQVMGHLGAGWLERPEREAEEKGSLLLAALELQPDHVVADIGAGSGYFTFQIAPLVPAGKVLAVDIQPEMLELIKEKSLQLGVDNVERIQGEITAPKLPQGQVDRVLMVDVYHEFSHPREMMEGIVAALKPEGKVYLIEYRAEDPNVPIKPRHKMTAEQATREMEAVGLRLIENQAMLPRQHCLIYALK